MNTQTTDDPLFAAQLLREGKLVAFPTETVFGLGADATNPEAVSRIFQAKGRPADNPLIVHVASVHGLAGVVAQLPHAARILLDAFAPGPITVVVPRSEAIAPAVSADLDTIAVRIPDQPIALEMLRAAGVPVAAPSANRSGRPSPTSWEAVVEDLGGRIDAVLMGPRCEVGLESTVVDCTDTGPAVLRAGGISLEQLRGVVPGIRASGGDDRSSPGTRHPHYAPNARVRLVDSAEPGSNAGYIGVSAPSAGYGHVLVAADVEEYAYALYDFFRTCDVLGLSRIDCAAVEPTGLGRALLDRIRRAAAGRDSEGIVDSSDPA